MYGLFVFVALGVSGNCFAQKKPATPGNQRTQFYFEKPITLDSLTKYVHSRSKIRFSFNSSKVKGDKVIDLKKGTYTIELLLQEIRKNTSLYYSMYNGYVVFQDNPPKQKIKQQAVVKKKSIKPPARRVQVFSRRKPITPSNNKKNTIQLKPGRGVESTPNTNTPPDTTNITPGQPDPVASIPAVVTDSVVVPVDTTLANNIKQPKSSDTLNASIAPTIEKKTVSKIRYRLRKKRDEFGNDKTRRPLNLQYGLQWKATVPLYGTQHYFTGANNRSQPYNLLIPGIWLSKRFNDKHELLLMVKPAEWYFYNNKEFRRDTTTRVIKSSRMLKTADLYAGLQYNFHINENWMVGGGIGYHRRGRALIFQEIKQIRDSVRLPDTLYSVSNDTLTSKNLANGFITGKIEVAYKFRAVDLGVTLLAPITTPFKKQSGKQSNNQSRPINLQIFVRWRIKK
ncbi:MAG TPA: STN domain-containing protein [Niastella sp.]